MKAEETLQRMSDFWDDMCPTRKHCLEHLFCTTGNGFEWVDGELVEIEDDLLTKRYKMIEPIEKAVFPKAEYWNHIHEKDKLICELTGRKPNPDYYFRWPTLNKYSYLVNYPENIKPDWKALIDECREMMIADGIDPDKIEE